MDLSVGILEFGSVVKGILAADEMLKSADITLVNAQTVCPGKYLIIVSGEISAVSTACERVTQNSGGSLDVFVSGRLDPGVLSAFRGTAEPEGLESLGVVETFSAPAAIQAADVAAKAAGVSLLEIRVSGGMGGKSFVLMTGRVGDVEAAADAVRRSLDDTLLLDVVVIPRPHPSVWSRIA